MTKLRVAVLGLAVIALFGCNGRESVTGSYGNRVVAGQVAMAAGMFNSSPAGVRVTVGATGMSAVLDATGNFMFVDVPENAELHFTRAEDGIDARLSLDALPGPLSIVLGSNGASTGRRRSVGVAPTTQYEGLVQKISDTEIQINGITLKITDKTMIRKGNTDLKPSDIKVGDRVHVQAQGNVALQIMLQNPGDDTGDDSGGTSATMTANGTVTEVSTDSLKVSTVPKGIVTVQVDSSTIIRKQGTIIHLDGIHVNDQVNTMGTRVDDHTLKATQIEVRGVKS